MRGLLRTLIMIGLGVASFPNGALAEPHLVTQVTVSGTEDKSCQAYFHNRSGEVRFPLILSLKGTGIYTTARSTQVEQALQLLYRQGRVTVLTLDKPGIRTDATTNPVVDDALYNRYVQEDLVRCASEALKWAAAHGVGTGPILLSGHSEGSQIAVRLLASLMTERSPLASRISAAFLSGLPLGSWRTMLSGQLSEGHRDKFFLAFARRDDVALRRFGNLSAAYLGSVFTQEPLDQTFDRLAKLGSKTELYIYQGLMDLNTPVAPVQALESKIRQQGGLTLTARYYSAGHTLNRKAVYDITRDVSRILASHD